MVLIPLYERNQLIYTPRKKARVFIISSTEGLSIARAIQNAYEYDTSFEVNLWTDGTFRVSHYALENLENELECSDFAIAIAYPDDLCKSRGKTKPSPRDNVLFELGIFIGKLGRSRTFLLEPGNEKIKLPTDLIGLNTITYRLGEDNDYTKAMAVPSNRIRDMIYKLGPRN